MRMVRLVCSGLLLVLLMAGCSSGQQEQPGNTATQKAAGSTQNRYPKVTIYSVSWCSHCKEAKAYLTKNNIPFVNRDVEEDEAAMEVLTKTYKSTGVPLIVLGNGEKVLRGFDRAAFERAVQELMGKK